MRLTQIANVVILLTGCSAVTMSSTTPSLKKPWPYQFGYTVKNDKTGEYQEVNEGKHLALGEPNGDLRLVTNTTDRAHGFQTLVTELPGASPVKPRSEQLQINTSHKNIAVSENSQINLGKTEENALILKRLNNSEIEHIIRINKTHLITSFENKSLVGNNLSDSNYSNNDEHEVFQQEQQRFDNHFDEESTDGPQIILVKIQEHPALQDTEAWEPEINIEMSTFLPASNFNTNNDDLYQQETEKGPAADYDIYTSLQGHNNEEQNTTDSLQTQTTNLENSIIKNTNLPEKELQSIKETNTTPNLTSITLPAVVNIEVVTTEKRNSDREKQFIERDEQGIPTTKDASEDNQTNKLKDSNYLNKVKVPELITENKITQAALRLPTGTTQVYPDTSDKDKMKATPTLSSSMPSMHSHWNTLQINQVPVKMFLTTGLPFYPFQLLNFKPKSNVESNTHVDTKLAPKSPVSILSTMAQETNLFDGSGTINLHSTTNSNPLIKGTPVSPITAQRQLTKVRTELVKTTTNQMLPPHESFHLNHHFFPPPWAPHPLRPMNNYHHRHMPIFVLPMSHNVNYAPTFNPEFENHNR